MESRRKIKSKRNVIGSVKVAPVTRNITEKRLKWYGHVKRSDEGHVLRIMVDAPVSVEHLPGKIRESDTEWKTENQVERLMSELFSDTSNAICPLPHVSGIINQEMFSCPIIQTVTNHIIQNNS